VTPAAPPRLVVLRALGMGDFLTAVPALRALAAAHPRHERLLVAPAWLEPLAALLGGAVTEVLHAEGRPAPPAVLPARAHGGTSPSTCTAAARRATPRCARPRLGA
jgi:hypothetical protein